MKTYKYEKVTIESSSPIKPEDVKAIETDIKRIYETFDTMMKDFDRVMNDVFGRLK
jgi:hypothetical protein